MHCDTSKVIGTSFSNYYANDIRRHTPYFYEFIKIPHLVIVAQDDKKVEALDEKIDFYIKDLVRAKKNLLAPLEVYVVEGSDHAFSDINLDDAMEKVISFLEGKMERITHFSQIKDPSPF